VAKFKPPPDLTQFLEQLRQQPPERLRELLQGPRSTEEADALNRQLRCLQPSPYVAAELALRRAEQEWRRWRAQIEQALGPRWRDDPEWAREDRHWSEHCALLRAEIAHLRQQVSSKKPQAPKPKKRTGGRSPMLTAEEISRLQAAYDAAQAKENRKQSVVFQELRKLLPKHKRTIKDRTLRRYIIESRS
jgi:hypothetical protein